MLGSGGRESFQVSSDGQDPSFRMQGLAVTTHSLAGQTRATVTLQNQGTESGTNTQQDSLSVISNRGKGPHLPHHRTHHPYGSNADGLAHHDPSRCTTTRNVSTMGGGVLSHATDNTVSCGDDLTSLSWLHSLDMGGMVPHLATPPTPPASPQPHNPLSSHNTHAPTSDRKRKVEAQDKLDRIDYSQDGSAKPPFSYAALIGMAMKENQNKMTLSAIYKWIKENFAYYKTADPSWQVSEHAIATFQSYLQM
ncbi:Forkhead box protein J1.2 [Portunus trituberculatus]|uniref:Forkhead box protein J1.2 n=1 Tax=Portunus trituberculatus TaxID=210409 RepID=A0A5B7IKM2_PORTR|nr:Forkhead box protein J1.2 [Portunus trituberculatus]